MDAPNDTVCTAWFRVEKADLREVEETWFDGWWEQIHTFLAHSFFLASALALARTYDMLPPIDAAPALHLSAPSPFWLLAAVFLAALMFVRLRRPREPLDRLEEVPIYVRFDRVGVTVESQEHRLFSPWKHILGWSQTRTCMMVWTGKGTPLLIPRWALNAGDGKRVVALCREGAGEPYVLPSRRLSQRLLRFVWLCTVSAGLLIVLITACLLGVWALPVDGGLQR